MAYTETQLRQFSDDFNERKAISLQQLPSTFGVITNQDEINRAWRLEISDNVDVSVALLRLVADAGNLPVDFDPSSLSESFSITDPMVDLETHEGTFRNARVQAYRGFENGTDYFYIIQTLRKGWITTLSDGEGGTDFSEFRIQAGAYGAGSFSTNILRLRGVAKSAVHSICAALRSSASYDDIACFNNTFSGTMLVSRVRTQMDDDGSYLIDLHIASSAFMSSSESENAFHTQWVISYRAVSEIDKQDWLGGGQSYIVPSRSVLTLSGAGSTEVNLAYNRVNDFLFVDSGSLYKVYANGTDDKWYVSNYAGTTNYYSAAYSVGDTRPPTSGWSVESGDADPPSFVFSGTYILPVGYTLDIQNSSPDDDGLVNAAVTVREAKLNVCNYVSYATAYGGSIEKVAYNATSFADFFTGTGVFDLLPATDNLYYDVSVGMNINEFGLMELKSNENF